MDNKTLTQTQSQEKEIILQTYPRDLWDECDEINAIINCVTNEKIIIEKLGEILDFIEIRFTVGMNLENIDSFCIYCGGAMIAMIPLSLMIKISEVIVTETHTIIKMHQNLMIKGKHHIMLYKLRYHNVEFTLLTKKPQCINYQLVVKYMKSNSMRKYILSNEQNIHTISKIKHVDLNESIYYENESTAKEENQIFECRHLSILNYGKNNCFFMVTMCQGMDFENVKEIEILETLCQKPMLGIFIETQKIDWITMFVDYKILFQLDYETINKIGTIQPDIYNWKKEYGNYINTELQKYICNDVINNIMLDYMISDYLYWIPVEPHKSWGDNNYDLFVGKTRAFSDERTMRIRFNESMSGTIYIYQFDFLLYKSGMGVVNQF